MANAIDDYYGLLYQTKQFQTTAVPGGESVNAALKAPPATAVASETSSANRAKAVGLTPSPGSPYDQNRNKDYYKDTYDSQGIVRPPTFQVSVTGGTATAGSGTLDVDGQVTAAVAYNAAFGAVDTAIEALSTVGAGQAKVTGGPLPGTPLEVVLLKGKVLTVKTTALTGTGTPVLKVSPA
jgi:hypothetical protein